MVSIVVVAVAVVVGTAMQVVVADVAVVAVVDLAVVVVVAVILSSEKTGPNFFPKISSYPEISSCPESTCQIVSSLLFCGALCFEGK